MKAIGEHLLHTQKEDPHIQYCMGLTIWSIYTGYHIVSKVTSTLIHGKYTRGREGGREREDFKLIMKTISPETGENKWKDKKTDLKK